LRLHTAIQSKRKEKVVEFFEMYGTELNGNPEWTKWFGTIIVVRASTNQSSRHSFVFFSLQRSGLPFVKNPTTDPNFETFFTKQWLDTFSVSLHNFLTTIFQNMRILYLSTFIHKGSRSQRAISVALDTLPLSTALPSLLCFSLDRLHRKALESEIETLQTVVEGLKSEIESSDHEISSLKEKVGWNGIVVPGIKICLDLKYGLD
jgi:hypothetical protein